MDKRLTPYYLSRTVLSIAFACLLYGTGTPIWLAMFIGGLIIALFLYAPRSGRYSVHPEFIISPLRRDEHTQAINDAAARNAFIVSMLAIGTLVVYTNFSGAGRIPVSIIELVAAIGALTYFLSDFWLRRSHQ